MPNLQLASIVDLCILHLYVQIQLLCFLMQPLFAGGNIFGTELSYKKLLNFDPYLITDKYNLDGQIDSFKENRHDQSVFSLLCKKYNLDSFSAYDCDWAYLNNERTWLHNRKSPFLAKRDLKYSIFRRFLNRQKKTYWRLKKRLLKKIKNNEKKI